MTNKLFYNFLHLELCQNSGFMGRTCKSIGRSDEGSELPSDDESAARSHQLKKHSSKTGRLIRSNSSDAGEPDNDFDWGDDPPPDHPNSFGRLDTEVLESDLESCPLC